MADDDTSTHVEALKRRDTRQHAEGKNNAQRARSHLRLYMCDSIRTSVQKKITT